MSSNVKLSKTIIKDIIGKKAWGVKLGHGSFITIEFGHPKSDGSIYSAIHGEWHLWVYLCSWRIERGDSFLVGCEDERSKIESVIKEIENKVLLKFDISFPSLDAVLEFEDEIYLSTFSIISEDDEGGGQHWMLFMPNDKVLVAGPGTYIEVEDDK